MSSSDDNIRGNEGPTAHEASTNPTGEHDLVGELAYKAQDQLTIFTSVDTLPRSASVPPTILPPPLCRGVCSSFEDPTTWNITKYQTRRNAEYVRIVNL